MAVRCPACGDHRATASIELCNSCHAFVNRVAFRDQPLHYCHTCQDTWSLISVIIATESADIRPYECPRESCGRRFWRNIDLKSHILAVHSRRKPVAEIRCDYIGCDKVFKQSCNYKRHRFTHTADRPIKCPVNGCDYQCLTDEQMTGHTNRHNGVQPYPCPHQSCGKRFASKANMRNHVTTHSTDRPYVCDHLDCNKRFKRNGDLKSHKRVHANDGLSYRCPAPGCDHRSFKSSWLLRLHRRTCRL